MKSAFAVLLVVVLIFSVESNSLSQNPGQANRQQTSNQALMRDKLAQMNRILEGITLDKFDQVQEGAKKLGMISKATSWHIPNPTPQYTRMSKNFQEQSADLERHARERNGEAATLDLVRMNITCAHCHQHMRESVAPRN
jgi:hypothetical protein